MKTRKCLNPKCDETMQYWDGNVDQWLNSYPGSMCPSCRYIGKWALAAGGFIGGAIYAILKAWVF